MSTQDWTPAPWTVRLAYDGDVDGIYAGDECIVETDSGYYPPELADARRIVAAINATKDMTTEGLELIASGGYEARLALLASLMLEEIKAKEKAEEEAETGEYPLSRGD